MAQIIIKALKKIYKGKTVLVSGADDAKTKDKKINSLDKDKRIIVATDAIKYGSDIQAVNYVINYDLPWNPSILSQRIKRSYRMGQKKNVTVINLIAKDTVDEYMMDILGKKVRLFDRIMRGDLDFKPLGGTKTMLNVINQNAKGLGML